MKIKNTFSNSKKALVGAGALVFGATNSFALTAADFSTGTAEADIALAVVAVLGLVVLIFGSKKVIGFFR